MSKALIVSDGLVREGLDYARYQFVTDEGLSIVEQCAELASQRVETFYAPAVRFTLDATLHIFKDKEASSQLASEIAERGHAAASIAGHVATLLCKNGLYARLYAGTPLSQVALSSADLLSLHDSRYMASLAGAPISDVQRVSGGAFKALEEMNVPRVDRPTVIRNSTGLLAITGVSKPYQQEVAAFLGSPYASSKHYMPTPGAEPRVSFTDEARTYLRERSPANRGCPAAQLEAHKNTILQQYWEKLVSFLVPSNATANHKP